MWENLGQFSSDSPVVSQSHVLVLDTEAWLRSVLPIFHFD